MNVDKKLSNISARLLNLSEDLVENENRNDHASIEFHARRLKDTAEELDKIRQFINGSGTGRN
jgi:hypothetical protein